MELRSLKMKKLITICLVCVCVLLTTAASQGMIITFDENGHGDVDGTPLKYGVDTPPIGHETLYYVLPFEGVAEGDIVVMEPPETASIISDILRFINVDGQGPEARVYVYSDFGEPDLADTGIPAVWKPVDGEYPPCPPLYMTEVGLEGGMNGIRYDTGGYPETYIFISDVPEPATICLLSLGALSLLRRKK
jgi:hypothetical protein